LWVGREGENRLEEISWTVGVAGAGNSNFTAAIVIGNKGASGSVAFQGDIGWMSFLLGNANGSYPLLNSTGLIADEDAERILKSYVRPTFEGRFPEVLDQHLVSGIGQLYVNFDYAIPQLTRARSAGTQHTLNQAITISGAVPSANRTPVPLDINCHFRRRVRR
jgi:hypothetical protein